MRDKGEEVPVCSGLTAAVLINLIYILLVIWREKNPKSILFSLPNLIIQPVGVNEPQCLIIIINHPFFFCIPKK